MARPRKHRHWSDEEKRSICAQTRASGVSVAQVARRYALNANLIFKWLNDPRFSPDGVVADEQTFLPVEIRSEAPVDSAAFFVRFLDLNPRLQTGTGFSRPFVHSLSP